MGQFLIIIQNNIAVVYHSEATGIVFFRLFVFSYCEIYFRHSIKQAIIKNTVLNAFSCTIENRIIAGDISSYNPNIMRKKRMKTSTLFATPNG